MSGTAQAPETHVMGWPLSYGVLQELAGRIQKTIDEQHAQIIGAFDPDTGFALIVHCTDRGPAYWECSGPMNERQATAWIKGIEKDLKADVAVTV